MKKTFTFIFAVLIGFGVTLPVSAEKDSAKKDCDKKECKKKTCKRKHKGAKMFRMMDSNKDSEISKAEWIAHFDAMDANKDGNLTKEEVKLHHKSKHAGK